MKSQKIIEKIWFADVIKELTNVNDFASAAKLLLEQQKRDWQQLDEGYKSLRLVQTKDFDFDGIRISVQFNPKRIKSTSAKVDEASIKERKCFLCSENLPHAQKGILYGDEYLILSNPYPIFPEHFTITNINHFPQRIRDVFYLMLFLSRSMHKYYTVFYNGPKCGASAPDHLHFQAGSKFFMPVEKEFSMLKKNFGELLFEDDVFSVCGIDDGIRRMISFEGDVEDILIHSFNIFYEIFTELINIKSELPPTKRVEEPMMNIISSYEPETGWRIIIFLRSKHRPSHYFAQGEKNILVSPAAVDLSGICITPLEKDFEKISKDDLLEIFQEVSIGKEYFEFLKTKLQEGLSR